MATENIEDEKDIKYVRPTLITLLSVWMLFSALMTVWFIFKGYGASSPVNLPLFVVGCIVFLVCGVGFWRMKKWALYIFAVYALLDQVALLLLGRWSIFSLLLFAVLIYIGYRYRSEMT
jgi:uncharacterized membrane protein (DUF2068 family)